MKQFFRIVLPLVATTLSILLCGCAAPVPYYGSPVAVVAPPVVVTPTYYAGYGYGYWYGSRYCAYRNGYYFRNGCYYRGGPRYYPVHSCDHGCYRS